MLPSRRPIFMLGVIVTVLFLTGCDGSSTATPDPTLLATSISTSVICAEPTTDFVGDRSTADVNPTLWLIRTATSAPTLRIVSTPTKAATPTALPTRTPVLMPTATPIPVVDSLLMGQIRSPKGYPWGLLEAKDVFLIELSPPSKAIDLLVVFGNRVWGGIDGPRPVEGTRVIANGYFTGRTSPVPFEIPYDSADIDQGLAYYLVVYFGWYEYRVSGKGFRYCVVSNVGFFDGYGVTDASRATPVLTQGNPGQTVELEGKSGCVNGSY